MERGDGVDGPGAGPVDLVTGPRWPAPVPGYRFERLWYGPPPIARVDQLMLLRMDRDHAGPGG